MIETISELPKTAWVIQDGIEKQLHHGVQLYVSLRGEPLAHIAAGEKRSGEPLDTSDLMLWLSSGKPLTAVAIAVLWEEGRFSLDDAVSKWIPEFAEGGKRGMTIRHLLTHTAGFRHVTINPKESWSEIIQTICQSEIEPDWIPGMTAGYHVASSWYILAELTQRLTGMGYSQFLRSRILEPLGMHYTWNGVPQDRAGELTRDCSPMYSREKGELILHSSWSEPASLLRPAPGGNTWGPIQELGRFYESLLAGLQGTNPSLLKPTTLEAMVARHRVGLRDLTFQHVIDFGLGFIINSKQYGPETVPYGFGEVPSRRAFGHGGAQSSLGFADPVTGLVVAYATNGMPGEGQHQRRNRALLTALYEDLNLD